MNKKEFFLAQKVNFVCYLSIYLIKSYLIWDFTNPFQWMINLAYLGMDYRIMVAISFVVYSIVVLYITGAIFEKKLKNK